MIRPRRRSDLEACVRALRAVHEADGYPVNWPADPVGWLDPPGTLAAWVFADPEVAGQVLVTPAGPGVRGQVVAAGLAGSEVGGPGAGEVGRLFVAPSHRGQGVGARLLGQAREWAAAGRFDLVLEVVDDGRGAAITLYERTGWTYAGTRAADWTGPNGEPIRVRRYWLPCPE